MEPSRHAISKALIAGLLTFPSLLIGSTAPSFAQETMPRKVKMKVAPAYPEMARRYGISGTVKLAVLVAPNGTVKSSTVVGGHPVLVNAAVDAVKKWKFETGSGDSTDTIEIKFASQDSK